MNCTLDMGELDGTGIKQGRQCVRETALYQTHSSLAVFFGFILIFQQINATFPLFPFHFACFHFYLLLRFQHFLCHFMLFLVLPSFLWFYYFFFHFFPELCQLPAFVFLSHARVCASVLYFHFMAVIALPQFFFSFSYIILA